jgi:hypothetical protein
MPTATTTPTPAAKLTSDQFAQQIKTKYPQYANVDNSTLTQKMLAKYPQYADRVDLGTPASPSAPPESTGSKVWNGILKAGTAVSNFVGAGPIADTYGTAIAKIGQTPQRQALIDQGPQPTVPQVVGSGAQVLAGLLPFGRVASVATKAVKAVGVGAKLARPLGEALTSVGTGYGYDVASNAAEGKTGADTFKPGGGTVIGTALPGAALVSAGVRKAAPGAAERVVNSLIKPLLKDFSYGKNPGRTVSQLGITGNNLDDLTANISQARQKIGATSAQLGSSLDSQVKLSVQGALSPIDEAMTAAARNNDATVLNRLQDVKKAISKVLVPVTNAKTGDVSIAASRDRQLNDLTYSQGLKIKQQIGDLTKFTGNASDDKAVNTALKKAYGSVKGELDKAASAVDPAKAAQLRQLNDQYADLTSAEIATKYRDKIQSRQNLIGISPTVAGLGTGIITAISTGGAAIPAVLAGAGAAALDKALASPAVKTRVAAALAKMKPNEAEGLFNKLPFLKNFQAPGDKLIEGQGAQKIGTYLKTAQPGLSMKNIANIHPTDKQVMIDFIDAMRTGKVGGSTLPKAKRLPFEIEARRAAPGYGINPELSPAKLANQFDHLLSLARQKGK